MRQSYRFPGELKTRPRDVVWGIFSGILFIGFLFLLAQCSDSTVGDSVGRLIGLNF